MFSVQQLELGLRKKLVWLCKPLGKKDGCSVHSFCMVSNSRVFLPQYKRTWRLKNYGPKV